MTVAEAYVHPGSMVLMEAGSYPTSRASSMIVASAAQRMGTVIKATDEMPQMGRLFPNLFIVLPPNDKVKPPGMLQRPVRRPGVLRLPIDQLLELLSEIQYGPPADPCNNGTATSR